MKAYGAVAYLQDDRNTALVMAKTRVAPVKELTLPQLELMAAVIGARLVHHLRDTLEYKDITLWSDSQIVLQWLKTSKLLKRFISNRIGEIKQLTINCNWKYCPTNCNPADLLTRGMNAKQFMENSLWKYGPEWLTTKNMYPDVKLNIDTNSVLSVVSNDDENEDDKIVKGTLGIDTIMDINKFSSYRKLLRITAYVLRFISNCRLQLMDRRHGPCNAKEKENSEM